MREITVAEDLNVTERFTVHYEDGSTKEVVNGMLLDMDHPDTAVHMLHADAEKILLATVAMLALCESSGLIGKVTEAVKRGWIDVAKSQMEVNIDEEPV